MKKLVNIVLGTALLASGCATSDKYEDHFRKEAESRQIIREIGKRHHASGGYLPHEEGKKLLEFMGSDYNLSDEEDIMLEPVYGPYNRNAKVRINVLVRNKKDPSMLTSLGELGWWNAKLYSER